MKCYKELEYKEISRVRKYSGRRLKVDELEYETPLGIIKREHVIGGEAVVILPITENEEVILIEEPRTPVGKIVLEIPAGMIEEGEDPKEAAIRELEEETGYKANSIEYLMEYHPSIGYSNEKLYIYVARNFEKTKQCLDEGEDIKVCFMPLEEVIEKVKNNEFKTASINIAVMYYLLNKNKEV